MWLAELLATFIREWCLRAFLEYRQNVFSGPFDTLIDPFNFRLHVVLPKRSRRIINHELNELWMGLRSTDRVLLKSRQKTRVHKKVLETVIA